MRFAIYISMTPGWLHSPITSPFMTWQWHPIRVSGGDRNRVWDPVWIERSDTNIRTLSTQISPQMGSKLVLSHFDFHPPLCLYSLSLSPSPWEIITVSNHAGQYGNDAPEEGERRRVIMQHPSTSSVHAVSISLTHTPLTQAGTNIHHEHTNSHAQNTYDWAAIRLHTGWRFIKARNSRKE